MSPFLVSSQHSKVAFPSTSLQYQEAKRHFQPGRALDTHLPSMTDRLPLKDTSKKFVNNIQPAPSSFNVLTKSKPTLVFVKPKDPPQPALQSPIVHAHKLTSGDAIPKLMGTSTPKKDGYVPCLQPTSQLLATNKAQQLDNQQLQQQQQQQQQQQVQVTTKKMTGNELYKWQQTWREILPKSFIYFEHDDSNDREKKKAMLALKKLGASIEPFFGENVTIIVSRRNFDKNSHYPNGDIFRYAIKKQLKVWTIEKVFRFLNHLGEEILNTDEYEELSNISNSNSNSISISNSNSQAVNNYSNNNLNNNNNNNLTNLLLKERLFGPSDCDPSVRRNDFKYFTGFYMYIWDLTHKTRPVAVREWKDKTSIPKIHHSTNGKSLFIPETKPQNPIGILKRHQRRIQCLEDSHNFRQEIIDSCYETARYSSIKIRIPTYEEREMYKRQWEGSYYKFLEEHPVEKLKLVYNNLSNEEKKPFAKIFDPFYELENIVDTQSTQIVNGGETNETNGRKLCDYEELIEDFDEENFARLGSDDKVQCLGQRAVEQNDRDLQILKRIPKLIRKDTLMNPSNSGATDCKLREYGEITASGIQASGINPSGSYSHGTNVTYGNGLAPSKSHVINKALTNETKRIIVLDPANHSKETKRKQQKQQAEKEQLERQDKDAIEKLIDQLPEEECADDTTNGKNSINDDQLAALRSVETANNPFVSDGFPNKRIKLSRGTSTTKTKKVKVPAKELQVEKSRINLGIFKEPKQEKNKHELKPGYCENCRVKYSDFSEHVDSKKHRSFAEDASNFLQIDELIKVLRADSN